MISRKAKTLSLSKSLNEGISPRNQQSSATYPATGSVGKGGGAQGGDAIYGYIPLIILQKIQAAEEALVNYDPVKLRP